MTKRQLKIIIIGSIIILTQVVLFRNYLPYLSHKIVVKGIKCTCPDAKVIKGEGYLKSITPDSLKRYNLIYSEIYFEKGISTSYDPMGVHQYIVTGKVIGKESISEGDEHYYPLFRIDDYYDAFLHNIFKWIIRVLLFIELIVLIAMVKRKRNDA
jgi:hypothetical protein